MKVSIVTSAVLTAFTTILTARAIGQSPTERIASAVVHDLCDDIYWGRPDSEVQGHRCPLTIAVEGDRFYARIKFRPNHLPSHSDYWGIDDGQRASIRGNYLRDLDEKLRTNWIETEITVPKDCTPHYDPETPEKRRMIETIVRSTQQDLSQWRNQGIRPYSKQVSLIIADFNVDDLYTYVLVVPQRDVLEVALHDPTWKDDAGYQQQGYISGTISDKHQRRQLVSKIQRHCVTREVQMNDIGRRVSGITPSTSGASGPQDEH